MARSNRQPDEWQGADVRSRIIATAAHLIAGGGGEAATTRAVADAAQVQAPTIYRLFGDKRGLLDAVAEQCFADYVAAKGRDAAQEDPVEDLRNGWDTHVAFGLANPDIYALTMAQPRQRFRAAEAGIDMLRERVRRIALSGRLRVSEEQAVNLIRAAGTGTILVLLQIPPEERGTLSQAARDAIFAAVLDEQADPVEAKPAGMASALRASLKGIESLTPGERHLLDELLQRIASTG